MRGASRILAGLLLVQLFACTPRPPEWTDGNSEKYPAAAYLVGVGAAPERAVAEDRARAEVAKIFQVQIHSREANIESEWLSRAGEQVAGEYRQSVEAELTATTDKVLAGVQIAEVWRDEKGGGYQALAILDRLRAARGLRSELDDIDLEVREQVRQAEAKPAGLRRLGHYLQALSTLERRRGIAADLRVVDPAGWVAEPPYAAGEIGGRIDREAASVRIGVELEGDRQGIVAGALVRALAGLGMHLAPAAERDLLVRGTVDMEQFSTGEPWQWSIASAQVEFVEADGTLLDTLRASVKEGSQVAMRSETLAREHLGEKLAALVLARIGSLGRPQQ